MANICEPLLNVVNIDKPKMLKGLNQKVNDLLCKSKVCTHGKTIIGGKVEPNPFCYLGGTW
jgi:hypothetical protein